MWYGRLLLLGDKMKVEIIELQLAKKGEIELSGTNGYVYGIETAQRIFLSTIGKSNIEKIGAIFVDSTNKIINYTTLAMGTINTVKLPMAELFKVALLCNATKFVIAHNHPSGILKVTPSDIQLTKKIGTIAKLFDMELIDSIIININGDIISIREYIMEKVQ